MIEWLMALAYGLGLGVLTTYVRVPRFRWVPGIAVLALTAVLIYLVTRTEFGSGWAWLVAPFMTLVSSTLYAGVLWRDELGMPGASIWPYLKQAAIDEGELRRRARCKQASLEPQDSQLGL